MVRTPARPHGGQPTGSGSGRFDRAGDAVARDVDADHVRAHRARQLGGRLADQTLADNDDGIARGEVDSDQRGIGRAGAHEIAAAVAKLKSSGR